MNTQFYKIWAYLYTYILNMQAVLRCHFVVIQEELQYILIWPVFSFLPGSISQKEKNHYSFLSVQKISNWFSKILLSSNSWWRYSMDWHAYWVPHNHFVMRRLALRSTMFGGGEVHMTVVNLHCRGELCGRASRAEREIGRARRRKGMRCCLRIPELFD